MQTTTKTTNRCLGVFPILLANFLALSSCVNVAGRHVLRNEEYFNIVIPEGFDIVKKDTRMDFDLYTIAKSGVPYCCVYVGNFPESGIGGGYRLGFVKKIISPGTTNISVWNGKSLVYREMWFEIKNTNGWPAFVQGFTAKLPEDKIGVADKIVTSIVVHNQSR